MFRLDSDKRVHFCDGVSRRDFLHAGSLGFLGLTMPHFWVTRPAGSAGIGTATKTLSATARAYCKLKVSSQLPC